MELSTVGFRTLTPEVVKKGQFPDDPAKIKGEQIHYINVRDDCYHGSRYWRILSVTASFSDPSCHSGTLFLFIMK